MKGLELCEKFYYESGREVLMEKLPKYWKYLSVGLVGEGSECFGFDDELSQDHDFGPGFCIWVPEHVMMMVGARIQYVYDSIPAEYAGYVRKNEKTAEGRIGAMSIEGFFRRYMGCPGIPKSNMDWLRIPESYLAVVTNGKVFEDNYGEFTKIRRGLLNYYPEDVVKKKLAARLVNMAQAGQYNYPRCVKRGDFHAAAFAISEFAKASLSLVHLLKGKYMPYYKWAFRSASELNGFEEIVRKTGELLVTPDSDEMSYNKVHQIEEICSEIRGELKERNYTDSDDEFLETHGIALMKSIADPEIGNLHILADAKG